MLDGRRRRTCRLKFPVLRRSTSSQSVNRCTGFAHGFPPFGKFSRLKLGECAAGQDGWQHTEGLEISTERRAAYDSLELAAKGLCHVGWQIRRCKYAPPGRGFESAIPRLGDGSNVGQDGGAHAAAYRNCAQSAALHIREHRLQRVKHDLKLPAEDISHCRCAAAVGNVLQVDASRAFEHLTGKMPRRAGSCGAEIEMSGQALCERYEISNGGDRWLGMHHAYNPSPRRAHNRWEVTFRVIGQFLVEGGIDGMRADSTHEQRASVGR